MNNEYFLENESNLVEDDVSAYNEDRDFTSLDAWKKARKVKLFFYNSVCHFSLK